jgi:hypothetical protein
MAEELVPQEQTPVPEQTGGDNVIQFGGIQMNDTLYATRMSDIRSDYASALSDINSQFVNLEGQIGELQAGISAELAANQELSMQSYERMIGDMERQITNINNAQNMQVTNTASQLDSMLASGQFGGNVYRSQQVYTMNMQNIIGTAMANVANVSLQYRQATEQLQATYNAQHLQGYIQGASIVMGAMSDLAKTYAMVRSDLTINKNNQINQVMEIKAQYDIANAQLQMQEYLTTMEIEARKLMTQWQLDASMQETLLKIELEDRRITSSELIAARNNETQLSIASMNDKLQRDLTKYNQKLQLTLQERDLDFKRWQTDLQVRVQENLGIGQINLGYAQASAQQYQAAKQYDLQSQQLAAQTDQFNQQFAITSAQFLQEQQIVDQFMGAINSGSQQWNMMMEGIQGMAASFFN